MKDRTFEPLLYRAAEVGELCGFSRAKAYELIADGTIPSIKVGSAVRVPAAALRAWITQKLEEATPHVVNDPEPETRSGPRLKARGDR